MWKIKTKFILSAVFGLWVAITSWVAINFYTWNQPIPSRSMRLWWIFFALSLVSWCIDSPAEKLFDALTHKESEKLKKQKDIELRKLELEEITIQEKIHKKNKTMNSDTTLSSNTNDV